jgi:hypothetical protein
VPTNGSYFPLPKSGFAYAPVRSYKGTPSVPTCVKDAAMPLEQ